MREQLSRQELSQEQVEQIKKDSAAWKAKIDAAETQKHNYQTQLEIVLREIDSAATQIETQLNHYHELLLSLQLFPATAPLANGTDFRIRLEHVEDCGSASSRDAAQYQKQISCNSVLERLDVNFITTMYRRVC